MEWILRAQNQKIKPCLLIGIFQKQKKIFKALGKEEIMKKSKLKGHP